MPFCTATLLCANIDVLSTMQSDWITQSARQVRRQDTGQGRTRQLQDRTGCGIACARQDRYQDRTGAGALLVVITFHTFPLSW